MRLASNEKKAFTREFGRQTAMAKERNAKFTELSGLPEIITDRDEGANELLVDEAAFTERWQQWNALSNRAAEEHQLIEGMLRRAAQSRLRVDRSMLDHLTAPRHQCSQVIMLSAAITSNL